MKRALQEDAEGVRGDAEKEERSSVQSPFDGMCIGATLIRHKILNPQNIVSGQLGDSLYVIVLIRHARRRYEKFARSQGRNNQLMRLRLSRRNGRPRLPGDGVKGEKAGSRKRQILERDVLGNAAERAYGE
ncbi:hypothetical protein FGB62_93g030 [Gracilaria domingensis]|nr:hypothetical protein FGB62_93g030 [Gracilaria domingensis]